jgi:hypothetical protein
MNLFRAAFAILSIDIRCCSVVAARPLASAFQDGFSNDIWHYRERYREVTLSHSD